MAVHDAYARVTPYELLLPAPDFADQRFPAVESEAVARGTDLANPAAFATCGAVQGILAELRPGDETPAPLAEPARASGLAHLLYFAFHLWRTARPSHPPDRPPRADRPPHLANRPQDPTRPVVALISRATLRALPSSKLRALPTSPRDALKPGWEAALLNRAGYLQLPQHMVWAEEPDAERPDSVDGFFWTAAGDGAFHAAAVMGMRPGRPGYGFLPVPPQPLDSLSEWRKAPAREDGDDFATDIPGGEIDGLLGLRTPAEVLKLLAFALERQAVAPAEDKHAHERAQGPNAPSSSPVPSKLPYVVL